MPGNDMSSRCFLLLSPRCRVTLTDQEILVSCGMRAVQLDGVMRRFAPVIARLQAGVAQDELYALVDDPAMLPWLYFLVSRLQSAGMLCYQVRHQGVPWATLGSASAAGVAPADLTDDGGNGQPARYRLVRFAYVRCERALWQLQCPALPAYVDLNAPAAMALLHALSQFCTIDELAAQTMLSPELVSDMIALLAGGALVQNEHASDAEPPAYRLWEFHDLLFHWGSRLGRAERPYGGTYEHPEGLPALPAVKPAGEGLVIALPAPQAPTQGADLAHLMAQRRSIRAHGAAAIDLAQLSQFLHRCARHIQTIDTDQGELAVRPYPAGGAMHELELYLVVERCDGLPRGLYHYRGVAHVLEQVSEPGADTEALLEAASATLAGAGRPQILIVISARFGRLSWKYRSVVYALVLKHVGVLYQTFYLVATDMGLAPCAMGGGDSDLFARASKLDPMLESSVGEFALGAHEEVARPIASIVPASLPS